MALIKCPNCGKDISDRASACPKCGYIISKPGNNAFSSSNPEDNGPIAEVPASDNQVPQKPKNKTFTIALVIVLVILGFICAFSLGKKSEQVQDSLAGSGSTEEVQKNAENEEQGNSTQANSVTVEEQKDAENEEQENNSSATSVTAEVQKNAENEEAVKNSSTISVTAEEAKIEDTDLEKNEETESTNIASSIEAGDVLINHDGCYIEYRGIEDYDDDDYLINLYIENNTEDDLYYAFDETVINGYGVQIRNSYIELPASSKNLTLPNYQMVIIKDDLSAYNINRIDTIRCKFKIMSKDLDEVFLEKNLEMNLSNNETVHDDGAKTENDLKGLGSALVDKDSYYVEYRGIEDYDDDDYIINLYIENNSEEDLYYAFDESVINGYNIQIKNSYIIIPSKSKNLTLPNYKMIINKEDLEAYSIDKIDNIKCTFKVMSRDMDEVFWETDIEISE